MAKQLTLERQFSKEACVMLDKLCSFFGCTLEDWEWTDDFRRIKPDWIIEWLIG